LEGMLKLPSITDDTVDFLMEQYRERTGEVRRWTLQVLAKMRFNQSEPLIREMLRSPDGANRLLALQLIKWYMPEGDRRFTAELVSMVAPENDGEAFRFLTNILNEAEVNMLPLMLPFFIHADKDIRIQALYQAGHAPVPERVEQLHHFIAALDDPEVYVQLIALQAMRGVTDLRLLEVFEQLLERNKTDKDYIRSNVKVLLAGFPFSDLEQVEREIPDALRQVKGIFRKKMMKHKKFL